MQGPMGRNVQRGPSCSKQQLPTLETKGLQAVAVPPFEKVSLNAGPSMAAAFRHLGDLNQFPAGWTPAAMAWRGCTTNDIGPDRLRFCRSLDSEAGIPLGAIEIHCTGSQ